MSASVPPVTVLDRGRVGIDANRVVEGLRTATASDRDPETPYAEGPVYNLVIDHPEATVLWDAGMHPEAAERWPEATREAFAPLSAPPLEASLADAGRDLDEIDLVIATHLHVDHAGGLAAFDGTDVPVCVHRAELGHAYARTATGEALAYARSDFDHDLNWRIVRGERTCLFDGLELLHLPGHTPGLLGTLLGAFGVSDGSGRSVARGASVASGSNRSDVAERPLLLTGDQAYVGANYEGERPLGAGLLWSRTDWERSLRRCRELERRTGARVVYGHDPEQVARFDELF
jgi:glyoxylase-like metal-dependent hydrolase (beta-lactamase superfamily II)